MTTHIEFAQPGRRLGDLGSSMDERLARLPERSDISRSLFEVTAQNDFISMLERLILDYRAAGGGGDGVFERSMAQLQNACGLSRSFLDVLPRGHTKSEQSRAASSLGLKFKEFSGRTFRMSGGDVVKLIALNSPVRYRIGLNRYADCGDEAEIARLLTALFREVRSRQMTAAVRISGPKSPWFFRFSEIVAACQREKLFSFWAIDEDSGRSSLGLALDRYAGVPTTTAEGWTLRIISNGRISRAKRWGLYFEPPPRSV